MVVVLALGASLANALTSVFQRIGVENAPAGTTLRLVLLAFALRRPGWLLGFALVLVSVVPQPSALPCGPPAQVQPILTTELVFLVAVLALWFGFRTGRREWLGALAVTGGLAGFLYFAHPEYGTLSPPMWDWIITGGACSGAIAIAVVP